ncbi:uncharacterized protein VTP21DRAFT_639 [Calcarisporiella thermophila]|uniref:uncharacterized protein n=1 Tax=Calcarisporiella thermophila TaxID=911321 RepID=UPI00374288F1
METRDQNSFFSIVDRSPAERTDIPPLAFDNLSGRSTPSEHSQFGGSPSSPTPPTTAMSSATWLCSTAAATAPPSSSTKSAAAVFEAQLRGTQWGWDNPSPVPDYQRRSSAAWLHLNGHTPQNGGGTGRRGSDSSENSSRLSSGAEDEKQQGTRKVRGELWRTEMCRTMLEKGHCPYSNKCEYAHSKAELRPIYRPWNYKTKLCRTFHEKGHCPYGKRCHYLHTGSPDEIPSNVIIWPRQPSASNGQANHSNRPPQADEQMGRRFSMPAIQPRPISPMGADLVGRRPLPIHRPISPISPPVSKDMLPLDQMLLRRGSDNTSLSRMHIRPFAREDESLFSHHPVRSHSENGNMHLFSDASEHSLPPPATRILPRDLMEELIPSHPTRPSQLRSCVFPFNE